MYTEEAIARDLYTYLVERLASQYPGLDCSIQGSGVHWQCRVKQDQRTCLIDCFEEFGTAQYSLALSQSSTKKAGGQTHSTQDILDATELWIQGFELTQLYQQFAFIDRSKRQILSLGRKIVAAAPPLLSVGKLTRGLADQYALWFEASDRHVYVGFCQQGSEEPVFLATFRSGSRTSSILFSIKTLDINCFAPAVQRWVCERALPSAIKIEFPWAEMEDLADFYEQGNLREGELMQSWNLVLKSYEHNRMFIGDAQTDYMIALVNRMRAEGYDRKLRAELDHLQLCLRHPQKDGYLWFQAEADRYEVNGTQKTVQSLRVTHYINVRKRVDEVEADEIALTSHIRDFLDRYAFI